MDVWAGLEEVAWAELEHAYGSAGDVPGCLRGLRDERREVREGAQWALYGNLFHQGSRYPASAAAIPFLIRLLADRGQADRAWILIYVAHLVTGGLSLSEDPWMCDGERLCLGREVVAWEGEEQGEQGSRAEARDWLACYRAAEAGIGSYLEAAVDGPTEVRVAALYLLACFWTRRERILPVLRARLASGERAPGARLALLFALGRLGAGAEPEIRARLSDPDRLVRLVAAAGQFWTGERGGTGVLPGEVGEEVVRALVEVLSAVTEGEGLEVPGDLPFLRGPGEAAAGLLLRLPPESLQAARGALRGALPGCRMFAAVPVVRALLAADFPAGLSAEPLTPAQRQTLRALAGHPDLWMVGNLGEDFRAHGLPFNREQVTAMLGEAIAVNVWRQDLQMASLYLDSFHDVQRALELAIGLLPAQAGAPEVWQLLGRALMEGAEWSAALQERAMAALDAEAQARWSAAAEEEGVAVAALLHALALAPGDGALWGALAVIRAGQDHPDAALAFGRAADLGFQRSVARQNQALVLFDNGRASAAISVLEREVEQHPEDENCWYHLGLLRCKIGDWERSMDAISRAILLDPGRADAWYTRACAAARLGMRSASLMDVAEALRLNPTLAGDIGLDEDFTGLRADPGFLMLIQQGQGATA